MLRIKGITEEQRDAIIQKIFEHEVAVNVHFVPLPLFSFYNGLGNRMEDYPQAFQNYSHEITLPVYYDLTDEMMDAVIKAVTTSVESIINL